MACLPTQSTCGIFSIEVKTISMQNALPPGSYIQREYRTQNLKINPATPLFPLTSLASLPLTCSNLPNHLLTTLCSTHSCFHAPVVRLSSRCLPSSDLHTCQISFLCAYLLELTILPDTCLHCCLPGMFVCFGQTCRFCLPPCTLFSAQKHDTIIV